jgi:hypothetical protein
LGAAVDFFKTLLFLRQWRVHLLNDDKHCPIQAGKKVDVRNLTTLNTALLTLHRGFYKHGVQR